MIMRGQRGRDSLVVGFTTELPMQSVPTTTDFVNSNLDQGEVYNSLIKNMYISYIVTLSSIVFRVRFRQIRSYIIWYLCRNFIQWVCNSGSLRADLKFSTLDEHSIV
jgi:hypothetical protein